MSLKTTFEQHPVIWGLSLLLAGFVAGFAARAYVLPASASMRTCTVEGLSALEMAHSKELEVLNVKLVENEAQAANHEMISTYQENYRASADRIRADIERSNRTYLSAVQALNTKCK